MKSLLLIFFFVLTLSVSAQEHNYKIALSGVTNMVEAKMATDYLRNLFEVYPTFNDETDFFEFKSSVNINQFGFEYYMIDKGYSVIFFSNVFVGTIEEEK